MHFLCIVEPAVTALDPIFHVGKNVTDSNKVTLLTSNWIPPVGFKFPATNGRRYSNHWEKEYRWLRYSRSNDAAFCAYCVLFGYSNNFGRGSMSMEFFRLLVSVTGRMPWETSVVHLHACHHNSEAHKKAAMKVISYLSIVEGTSQDIRSCLSEAHKIAVKENRDTLMSIIDVVIALGKRNVPFRGNWDKESKRV